MRRWLLLAPAVLVLTIVATMAFVEEAPHESPVSEPHDSTTATGDDGVAASVSSPSRELPAAQGTAPPARDFEEVVDSAPPTLQDVLSEFWGEDWPEVRAQIAEGHDLDNLFVGKPWEEAADELLREVFIDDAQLTGIRNSLVGWPETLNEEWIQKRYHVDELSEEKLEAIQKIGAEAHPRLDELSEDYLEQLDSALLSNWESGRFVRAPVTLQGSVSPYESVLVYSKNLLGNGWAVNIGVEKGAFPRLDETERELRRLRQQRDLEILKTSRPQRFSDVDPLTVPPQTQPAAK